MAYNAELYMHELDRRAFDALNSFPGLLKLGEAYNSNFDERTAKYNFLSSAIRLGEKQMPEIYGMLPPICDKLGIDIPELYYVKSNQINAATLGSKTPYIYVTSKMVEEIPAELISSVLAHECGHIACKHTLYHSIAGLLIDGLENSPLRYVKPISRLLTPSLVKALLFWDRCSELSADRAAVLCDGSAEKTINTLLKVHGYDDNINRDEFIRQALDLKDFVNESRINKAMEQMLVQGESHPRMATRVYECYEWERTEQFKGILSGTYSIEDKNEGTPLISEKEVISAEISLSTSSAKLGGLKRNDCTGLDVDAALNKVNQELVRYTNRAEGMDYIIGVASGLVAGMLDAGFVGELKVTDADIGLAHKQVNNFIQKYAKARGFDRERLKDAIGDLEKAFKVAQDDIWKGAQIGVSAKNHHLADLAHHPTPLGLASAIAVQFLRIGTFVNKDGEWHFKFIKPSKEDLVEIITPAILTGMLNWLVALAEKKYEDDNDEKVPEVIHRIAHIVASTPLIMQVAKCADNWFGHLVSDMGGSKNTAGGGMGIPGIFVSFLYEIAGLPVLKDSGLPAFVNDLYENHKMDLRHEIVLYKQLGLQAIPVAFNEIFARTLFFLIHLEGEIIDHGIKGIDWSRVIPFRNRTIDRVMMVASMTFNIADTTDAAVHAAIDSCGSWVIFSGKFVARYNYVGAGRAALAIVKEISNEKKEAELIHEKLLLTEIKTRQVIEQVESYKRQLEEKVSLYLAEDISEFMNGFECINAGVDTGDSDLVIKGNIIIQRVLGRAPQFTNQREFDALMDSDEAFKL